jgi:hypothetical protein
VLKSSAHAGKWGLQPISGEEILLCNDIGTLHVALLVEEHLGNGFYLLALPGKCLVAGFRPLFYEGCGVVVGGVVGRTEDAEEVAKSSSGVGVEGRPNDSGDTVSLPCATKLLEDCPTLDDSTELLRNDFGVLAREKRERSPGFTSVVAM